MRVAKPCGSGRATGLSAIIRSKDKNCVVVLTDSLEVIDKPTNMKVHRLDHSGVHRHALGLIAPLTRIQCIPVARR